MTIFKKFYETNRFEWGLKEAMSTEIYDVLEKFSLTAAIDEGFSRSKHVTMVRAGNRATIVSQS